AVFFYSPIVLKTVRRGLILNRERRCSCANIIRFSANTSCSRTLDSIQCSHKHSLCYRQTPSNTSESPASFHYQQILKIHTESRYQHILGILVPRLGKRSEYSRLQSNTGKS